jgi:glycosyltransferase involved in cell wall biosynthesis
MERHSILKILHLTNHLNTGGITTYIRTLAAEQVKAGHEVFVWGAYGICSEPLKAMGVTVLDGVPRCKSELSPRLWLALPRLMRVLKDRSIDIIHTHTRVTQVLASAATFFVPIPYISTAHMFYKRRLGRRIYPCWGKEVIAISRTMRNGLITIFGERNLPPITVVLNGIDVENLGARVEKIDRDTIRKDYGYQESDLVVLSLSRLIPVKGVHVLIEAFADACRQVPQMKLLVAGAGDAEYINKLQNRSSELGIKNAVHFLGNEPVIEKPLKAADIFVAPYLWPEAFGLSILEAMVAGLPLVGSNSGGIEELLAQGARGLLFERENAADLTRCLLDYARDPELRSRMGKLASQGASDYSSKNMYEGIQKVYERVAGERL